jgi:hypothetical protein
VRVGNRRRAGGGQHSAKTPFEETEGCPQTQHGGGEEGPHPGLQKEAAPPGPLPRERVPLLLPFLRRWAVGRFFSFWGGVSRWQQRRESGGAAEGWGPGLNTANTGGTAIAPKMMDGRGSGRALSLVPCPQIWQIPKRDVYAYWRLAVALPRCRLGNPGFAALTAAVGADVCDGQTPLPSRCYP